MIQTLPVALANANVWMNGDDLYILGGELVSGCNYSLPNLLIYESIT